MARSQSPGYPHFALPKALEYVRKIFSADRRNPIDREVAAKHCGYGGISGASDKVLASLSHYGLLERAGKGQVRVTDIAVDILHPASAEQRKEAIHKTAYSPSIFVNIRENFSDGMPSEEALKSWLMREEFLDRAINPVTKAYLGTCQYLEQEKAFESGGIGGENESESPDIETKPEIPMQPTPAQPTPADPILASTDATVIMPVFDNSAPADAVNKINMNIQGDSVQISGVFDFKGLVKLEKKIAGLKTLMEPDEDAEE